MNDSGINQNNLKNENDILKQKEQNVLELYLNDIDIDPKYDIAFKHLFKNEKKLMIDFLNSILELKCKIKDVTFKDNEIVPVLAENAIINDEEKQKENDEIGKFGRTDVLLNAIFLEAQTEKNKIINIEIQFNKTGNMFKRSLFYASGIVYHSLPRGASYDKIPDVIMINLLNYNLYRGRDKCHWIFELREKETNKGEGFEELLNIHFIELRKFKKKSEDELKNKYPWIFFLNEPNNKYFVNENTPEIFKKAREKLFKLSRRKDFRSKYEKRRKDWTDLISTKSEGRARGRTKGRITTAISMLMDKEDKNKIKKHSRLSEDEVNIIEEFLNNQNYQINDFLLKFEIDENVLIEICTNYNINLEGRRYKKNKTSIN